MKGKGLKLSVTQLNDYVRRSLASDPLLQGVCVTGELSNLKRHVSGHWYFTLKDEEAAVNCAMFRSAAAGLAFRPENGQRVRVYGSVGLYVKTGSYQLYAEAMEPDGLGDLYLRFEALKKKLSAEGLFDPARKQKLPFLPRGIGIATSKTGAVVHDIARVAWRRFPGMPLYLYPVKVQGEGAAGEIAEGIRVLDSLPEVDVIIVGRGGGSMEDLWAFNEEVVARAIAACAKPVISAVGHETDFTIADFVADVRAATPSAAAEIAVPEKNDLLMDVQSAADEVDSAMLRAISQRRMLLSRLQNRLSAHSPEARTARMRTSLQAASLRLNTLMAAHIAKRRQRIGTLPALLDMRMQSRITASRHRLEQAALRMKTSGPMETMQRGYAVVMKKGSAIKSAADAQKGDRLTLVMADGRIAATVDESLKG